jgi:putative transposase
MHWNNRWGHRHALVVAMRRRRESVKEICLRFGVSRALAYRLLARCNVEGWSGAAPRRRGPRGWCRLRAGGYFHWVGRLRRSHPSWGGRKLWRRLRQAFRGKRLPSLRTVERWLKRQGLIRPRPKRQRVFAPPLQPVRQARRSNDRWSLDWKGWVRCGDGRKVEPLTVRDEASGMILFVRPLATRSEQAVQAVCRRLFRRYGRPRAIRVDQGGPFCGHGPYGFTTLSLWWHRLGIRVEFVNRKIHLHNNAHEQMHGVLAAEAMRLPAATYQAMGVRLRRWQTIYNYERPHDARGGRVPAQCYRPRPAPLPQPKRPVYPGAWLVRRVARSGSIALHGHPCYVGRAFVGQFVGCQSSGEHYRIHYDQLLLRTFLPAAASVTGRGLRPSLHPPALPRGKPPIPTSKLSPKL